MFLHVEGFQVEVKPALLPWEAATVHEFRLGEIIGLNYLVNCFWTYNFVNFEQNMYYHPTEAEFTKKANPATNINFQNPVFLHSV
jgi:hypothetical protein